LGVILNVTRNLLHKLYADSVTEREAEVLTQEAKDKIKKFEDVLSNKNDSDSSKAQGQGFCGGVCFALTILVVCTAFLSAIVHMYYYKNVFHLLQPMPKNPWK